GHHVLPFQNNPTVSSVNTPTLSTRPLQNQGSFSPESSVPGTPGEMDTDFGNLGVDMMSLNGQFLQGNNGDFGFGFGGGGEMLDLCIDEPAKRLFSPNGSVNAQQQRYAQSQLGGNQFGHSSEISRRIRERQIMQGL